MENNTETVATESNSLSLIRNEEGSGFVEKILIVALFAFVVAAGIRLIASGANSKLEEQGQSIGAVNGQIGGAGGAGGA